MFFEKNGHESECFWQKIWKIKNKLKKIGMGAVCFWRKMKSKNKTILSMSFFLELLWIVSLKTRQSHAHLILLFEKKQELSTLFFLLQNFKNQKYTIISTSFLQNSSILSADQTSPTASRPKLAKTHRIIRGTRC